MGQWVFEPRRGGPLRNPQEAELFKDDQTDEGEYAGNDHLVREVIQNSLDAAARPGIEPVQVMLTLHDAADAPPQERLAHYFRRLKEPLAGRDIGFRRNSSPELECRYLVCEDFGTRGLEGDTDFYEETATGEDRQDFYWFWRNIGKSGKTGDDLGRWGLGKTVFRAVSRVGSMLGLTIRESDRTQFLMGQSVLQAHRFGGVEFHPEGYWCGEVVGDLPMPIDDPVELTTFRREWRLTRTDEPGTSIVSPYVPDKLNGHRILQAVIVHFFTRILRDELEVEVAAPEFDAITLNAQTIEEVCERIGWSGSKRMKRHQAPPIEFARQCLANPPAYTTSVLGTRRAPEFTEECLPAEELQQLRQSFFDGELASAQVKVALPRRQGEDHIGAINVFLQRHNDGQRRDSYYVREGMTITKINSTAGRRGVQALVIVDKGPMAKLLGDTEGPAHEDWDAKYDRADKEWKSWGVRMKFARRIVDNLCEFLTPPTAGPDRELLADFFSIELTQGMQRMRQKDQKEPGDGNFPPLIAKPRWYYITERAGGFRVARNQNVPLPAEAMLRVAVAYDLPRGNPLRNWSPIDFEISNKPGGVTPDGEGLRPKLRQGNLIDLEVVRDQFWFSLDGFDPHRDLYVRVDDISGTNGEVTEGGDD
jgi:hypothetical protein